MRVKLEVMEQTAAILNKAGVEASLDANHDLVIKKEVTTPEGKKLVIDAYTLNAMIDLLNK